MTEPGIVIYRDGELSDESLATLARTFGFPREQSGFLAIPHAPNARGLAALEVPTVTWDEILGHTGGVVYLGVDADRHVPASAWGPAFKRAAWVACVDALPAPVHAAADLVVPAAWGGEQDGTLVNLEGRVQRMTVGAGTPGEVVPQLRWIAGLARRLGATVPGHAAGAYRLLAASAGDRLPAASHGEIGPEGVLGTQGGTAPVHAPESPLEVAADQLALYVAPSLFDAAEVQHTDAMRFLTDTARLQLNRADARGRGLSRGDVVRVDLGDQVVDAVVATSTRVAPGHARIAAGSGTLVPGRTGWHAARIEAAADVAATVGASGEEAGE